jgi:hypothetical protein
LAVSVVATGEPIVVQVKSGAGGAAIVLASVAVLAVVVALAAASLHVGGGPTRRAAVPAKPASATASTGAAAPAPSLAAAFAVVYPKARLADEMHGVPASFDMKPLALVRMSGDTFALVSAGRLAGEPAAHADGGYASVAYLTTHPTLTLQGRPFHLEGTMGGWGEPPQVTVLTGVSRAPMLQVLSGYYNQGEGDSSAYLVALGPSIDRVELVSDGIPLSYTNAATPDSGCDIDGKIVPVTPDKVFEVRYSGSFEGRVRYRRTAGGWEAAEPVELREHCR